MIALAISNLAFKALLSAQRRIEPSEKRHDCTQRQQTRDESVFSHGKEPSFQVNFSLPEYGVFAWPGIGNERFKTDRT
jgi:hypothetical protein